MSLSLYLCFTLLYGIAQEVAKFRRLRDCPVTELQVLWREAHCLQALWLVKQRGRKRERERGKVKVNAVTPVKDIKFKVLLNIVKLKVQWTLVEHTWSALLCMSASFWLVFWLSKNWWLRGQLQTREEILSQCAAGDEWQSPYTRNEDNEGNISCSCLT